MKKKSPKRTNASKIGWQGDVLSAIRALNKLEFSNKDIYGLVPRLKKLHPANAHIEQKIRQQLQVLRDAGKLIHVRPGRWRVPWDV